MHNGKDNIDTNDNFNVKVSYCDQNKNNPFNKINNNMNKLMFDISIHSIRPNQKNVSMLIN